MINLKNSIDEKSNKFQDYWDKRWWQEFRFIVDVEYTGLQFLLDHLPDNEDMFNYSLFDTSEGVLRWWIDRKEIKEPTSYLFEKNYVHMYSIIDSMVENIYKGFFRFSNNWTKDWIDNYYSYIDNQKKDSKNEYISENKLRYDYLFSTIGNAPYYKNEEEFNSWMEAYIMLNLRGLEKRGMLPNNYDLPKSWNFTQELKMFNGQYRLKRNRLVHQYFSDIDITIDHNDFIKVFSLASRVGIAVCVMISIIEVITREE